MHRSRRRGYLWGSLIKIPHGLEPSDEPFLRAEGLPAVSALDELTAGAPGADFVELLRLVIRAVGPGDGSPAPEGHDRWDGSALITCIADFFASTQTWVGRYEELVVASIDRQGDGGLDRGPATRSRGVAQACQGCRPAARLADLPPGWDRPVPRDLRDALRCSRCGARRVASVDDPHAALERSDAGDHQRGKRRDTQFDVGNAEHEQRSDDEYDVDEVPTEMFHRSS